MVDQNDGADVLNLQQYDHGRKTFPEIRTLEQGRNYVLEIVEQVEKARANCDVIIPGNPELTARSQRKAYNDWRIRYGQALGTLTTLMRCRVLNDVAYMELRERVMRSGIPTVVGRL